MQRKNQPTKQNQPKAQTPPTQDQLRVNHRCQHDLTPKQLLSGAVICSRFEQISGRRLPKRMTTGKFVYLGPPNRLPDSPL